MSCVNICVKTIYVCGEKVCLSGDSHGPNDAQKMLCIFNIAWMFPGEGTQEICVLCYVVSGDAAIRNYWCAGRNLKADRPGVWIFVYFWE